jgi:extradiol dioxygenase family protein
MDTELIFHLAIPINDIDQAKKFYCDGLGCSLGRQNSQALILNFYGHQLVAHKTQETLIAPKSIYPRHFGLIFLNESHWNQLLNTAQAKNLEFYEQPKLRFPNQLTEHSTFFLQDPFYNLLEFKFYRHKEAIFGGKEINKIGDR